MGKFSRDKGARYERKIVNTLRENGIDASRVPLSGSAGGNFSGDVDIRIDGQAIRAEVKARKTGSGFTTINNWLGDNNLLFCIANNQEPMVVMTMTNFINIMNMSKDQEDKNVKIHNNAKQDI